MAFASHRPFTIRIKTTTEDRYFGRSLNGPTLWRLQELALDPKYEELSFLGISSSSITERLQQDFPNAELSASQIKYELLVMKSGPDDKLWTPEMEQCLKENYRIFSVIETTFELVGKFRVRLTDQETYKKLQRMRLENKI